MLIDLISWSNIKSPLEVLDALRTSSSMMSVGMVTEGKRSYTVRSEAELHPTNGRAHRLRADISASGAITPLLLEDVATLDMRFPKQTSFGA